MLWWKQQLNHQLSRLRWSNQRHTSKWKVTVAALSADLSIVCHHRDTCVYLCVHVWSSGFALWSSQSFDTLVETADSRVRASPRVSGGTLIVADAVKTVKTAPPLMHSWGHAARFYQLSTFFQTSINTRIMLFCQCFWSELKIESIMR